MNSSKVFHPYTDNSTFADEGLLIVEGKGYHVFDEKGRKYIDGISGLWNVNVGHGRERIAKAIHDQLKRLEFFPVFGFRNKPSEELADLLIEISPLSEGVVFYSHSGTEANETAIKLARLYHQLKGNQGKNRTLSLSRGWHGCSLGSLGLTEMEGEKKGFGPFPEGYYMETRGLYNGGANLDDLLCKISPKDIRTIAALFIEPVVGAGGFYPISKEHMISLKRFCEENGILFVADEVATGFGRTGTMFGIEFSEIVPDMITIAKGVTSGYQPLSGTLIAKHIFEPFSAGVIFNHGYTTQGHPVCCAAAIENIKIIQEEHILENSKEMGRYLMQRLCGLHGNPMVKDIRGRGLMIGIELTNQVSELGHQVSLEARRRGLIIRNLDNLIPLMPPLTIDKEGIDQLADILFNSIGHMQRDGGEEI
ncbi:aspartate aminotransferase family protein [Candidatus Woesearchaeota archaeon]|nr:aspartate aminotransferase family protein [Candidatus Woesearchaeota archaeon]